MSTTAAIAVHQALLEHALDAARACPLERARRVPRVDPAARVRLDADARKFLHIGCDCPRISKDSLTSSPEDLDSHDTVLGPTGDGGYYLLGLKGWHPYLFQGIPWSTVGVLGKTLNIQNYHSLSYLLRDPFLDVDTQDDYHRARHLEPLKRLGIG